MAVEACYNCGLGKGNSHMNTVDLPRVPAERPAWQSPRLQELGNIRRFVQTGGANGKSGTQHDGNSKCGGEAMYTGGPCTP